MKALAMVMIVLGLLGTARASEKDKFTSLIGKYGSDGTGCVPGTFKPKNACYCTSGAALKVAGFLVRYEVGGLTYVDCYYPRFDASGALSSCGTCSTFEVLAK